VVSGEGEDRIVALAQASVHRDLLESIHGIHYRNLAGKLLHNVKSSKPINLDESPAPDYCDFYSDVEELRAEHLVSVTVTTLPVESSRGCWWGQVHHCTFCGIDDETMRFRNKKPETVGRMLDHMGEMYPNMLFRFSDYILPRSYYRSLLPSLAAKGGKHKLHWEIKANVRADEVQLMKKAGIIAVQPGIESFSTPVLRKMDKGVSAIQNILTIKLFAEADVVVNYNILFGFPDDDPNDYRELLRTIPCLYHLPPPTSYIPIQITRYAPLQANPVRWGIFKELRADLPYKTIFSEAFRQERGFVLEKYAYVFETPYEFQADCSRVYGLLIYQVAHWLESYNKREVGLSYEFSPSGVTYRDSRYQSDEVVLYFGPIHAKIQALVSDQICTSDQLVSAVSQDSRADVLSALDEMHAARVLFREGNKYVGLAFHTSCYQHWRERAAWFREIEKQQEMLPLS
jgi:ribosomal peptide maturation radical SAM protein 1